MLVGASRVRSCLLNHGAFRQGQHMKAALLNWNNCLSNRFNEQLALQSARRPRLPADILLGLTTELVPLREVEAAKAGPAFLSGY